MSPQKIVITGGTGFIGRELVSRLLQDGHTVTVLTRQPETTATRREIRYVHWNPRQADNWYQALEGQDVLVNLAGSNIAGGLWTAARKRQILESRIQVGQALVAALQKTANPPHTLLQASGIGFYGSQGDTWLDESAAAGTGFLAEVARSWEAASADAPVKRRIVLRIGVVLGHGGFLPRVKIPFRFFVGGHLGSGRQWFSWIHLTDLISAMIFLMQPDQPAGIYNLSSPNPVTARNFYQTLGQTLHRPSWLHVPEFTLKLLLREMAEELLLPSQRAIPPRLLAAGFKFQFPEISDALHDLVK